MPRVFSYVVVHDGGFSPNPFHGRCTLACCKPAIRRTAAPGDLIVGLATKCATLVYIAKVDEKLPFEEYWEDRRFRAKRPDWNASALIRRCGENIYGPGGDGAFRQLRSAHWDHERNREDQGAMRHDTSGPVLAASEFVYFGADGPPLPDSLDFLRVARGHRCRFSEAQVSAVHQFFDSLPRGVRGRPRIWSDTDRSWRPGCA